MTVPGSPKLYHIVHVDRLPSILGDGGLWCDAETVRRALPGTRIGMGHIKHRRLYELTLASHPGLHVGSCVPFYFCPRSVMLYVLHRGNSPDLRYVGGQEPIIHLEARLHATVSWADENGRRWAFTLTNAGSYHFEDRGDLAQLHEIDWGAVQTRKWSAPGVREKKQAEFLLEGWFPWQLVERVGVCSRPVYQRVANALAAAGDPPGSSCVRIGITRGKRR